MMCFSLLDFDIGSTAVYIAVQRAYNGANFEISNTVNVYKTKKVLSQNEIIRDSIYAFCTLNGAGWRRNVSA